MSTNDNVIHLAPITPLPALGTRPAFNWREHEGPLFGGLAILTFSVSMVGTRAAAPELGGLFVGLGRGLVAALLAAVVLWVGRVPVPARRHWPGLFVVSAGSVLGFPVLSGLALTQVSASDGMVYTAMMPVMTAVVAVLRAGERPTGRFWRASLIACALVVGFALRKGGGAFSVADMQLLVGIALPAIGYGEGGRLSRELGGMAVLSWALVFSLPVLVPATLLVCWWSPPTGDTAAWLGFGYVSIFSMYLGFMAWYRGMARGGIARISQLQAVQPLLGLGWAGLLLGEPLSWDLALTAVGVIVCLSWGRQEPLAGGAETLNPAPAAARDRGVSAASSR